MPIVLAVIMLGLGLHLTTEDFKRVVRFPKAILVGLFCQMLILPIICFGLCIAFNLSPALSVGMMLLAGTPGGATANLFSNLANGDVALNITLTAVNAVITLFTLPLIVVLSMTYFMDVSDGIPVQFSKIIEVFSLVLVPVGVGMFIKTKLPSLAKKVEKPVKVLSVVFLFLVIIGALTTEGGDNALDFVLKVGIPCILFNIISMNLGYFVSKSFKLSRKQSIAIGMEAGIHNGILAMYIGTVILGNNDMAIPAGVYGITALINAGVFVRWLKRGFIYKPY